MVDEPIDPKITDATRKAFSSVTALDPAEQVYLVARGFWWAYWYKMKVSSVLPDEVKGDEEKLDNLLRFPKEKELDNLSDSPQFQKIEGIFASIRPRKEPSKKPDEEAQPEEKPGEKKPEEKQKAKELTDEQKNRVKKIQSIVLGWKIQKRRDLLFAKLFNIPTFRSLSNPLLWKDPKKLEIIFKKKKDPDKSMRDLEEIIDKINASPKKTAPK